MMALTLCCGLFICRADLSTYTGVKPNVITFTTLISCCQRAGQWKRARQYFTEMEQEGIRPDVKAYNSLLSACSRGARWEEAWDICSSMRRSDVQPNVRTYNALISACSRAGEPERALEAYRRMERGYGENKPPVPLSSAEHRRCGIPHRVSRGNSVGPGVWLLC